MYEKRDVTYSADTGQRYTLVSYALERCNKQHGFSMLQTIARFLRYSDRELVMEQARVHVFDDIPKELYDLRKEQIVKLNEARQKGYTAYFSKAHPDKLFVNGKYIAPERPLE